MIPLTKEFPTRDELLSSKQYRAEAVHDLYELWEAGHSEAQELAKELLVVFGDPPRPEITQHVARGLDDEWTLSLERKEELSAMDTEEHWYEVSDAKCINFQEYFTFSDPEGWRFYLPAYLRHYLSEFPLCGYTAAYDACLNKRSYKLKNLNQLNEYQLRFIDRFLDLCDAWED